MVRGYRWLKLWVLCGLCALPAAGVGRGQDVEQAPPPRPLPQPATNAAAASAPQAAGPDRVPAASAIWPGATPVPMTLPAALRLALVANLDIAQAREAINAAQAALERARVSILPNFNLGSTYTEHEGNIAKTEGNIEKVNKDALFLGGGPSLNVSFTDALFGPLTAQQLERASEAGLQRVTNDTLLAVADAYFNVLLARRQLARIDETLDYLTANRVTPGGRRFLGLLPLVAEYVRVGGREASRADLERVRVEILLREQERITAIDNFQLAVAELARLLRLDPTTPLWPVEDFRYPLPLPGDAWASRPIEELVVFALANRPELAENQALVRAALERLRAARYRPFIPNAVVDYDWGDYGGAPDINPKGGYLPSGRVHHFAPRQDFDASLIWRLDNMGLGNRAEVHQQEAQHRQALLRQLQAHDRVATQVVEAREQVASWRERVRINQAALFDAKGAPTGPTFQALRLDFERIRGAEGRPLEAVDSIRRLSDILEAYGLALTGYERWRFHLLIALGLSPGAILDPRTMPSPGGPVPCGAAAGEGDPAGRAGDGKPPSSPAQETGVPRAPEQRPAPR